jgi:myo-inositol-1(or 4)-monophosphatase
LPKTPAVTVDPAALEAFASFAGRLADAAGRAILPHFRSEMEVENKASGAGYDPVTLADRAAETALRQMIHAAYPGHGVFGEEFGLQSGDTGLTWVIDPIDGTRSFMSGLLHWATLIALYDGEKPLLGVIDQPYVGERFIGSASGARLVRHGDSPAPLCVRRCQGLETAILCATGRHIFAADAELEAFDRVAAKARMVHYGGDCYLYCMLAAGRVDLVIESTLGPHDVQALIPLVDAAGGIITDWSGGSAVDGGQVVAAGDRRVYEQAIRLLCGAAG